MPQEFACPECGNTYDTKRGLHIHIGRKHPDRKESILSELEEEEGKEVEEEKKEERVGEGLGLIDRFKEPLVSRPMEVGVAILILIIVGAFLFIGYYLTQGGAETTAREGKLTPTEAGEKTVNFIGSLPQLQGADVSLVNASGTGSGVYKLNVKISSQRGAQTRSHYVTKDGELLFPDAEEAEAVQGLSPQEAGEKAAGVMSRLPQVQRSNLTIEFLETKGVKSGVYEVVLEITTPRGRTQNLNSYVTKDGKYFFPQGVNVTEQMKALEEQQTQGQTQQRQTAQKIENKTETPTAELFVMSFCPYGNQAENTMEPVFELLGNKVNWEPHYIVSERNGEIQSLHGQKEVEQDKREICALKNHGVGKWFNFVTYVDENCGSSGDCWKKAAENAGLSTSEISTCAEERGTELLKEEAQIASKKGASGSPTLLINGQKSRVVYQYGNSEAYKDAICSAFKTKPEACSQTLSGSSSSTPSGGNC